MVSGPVARGDGPMVVSLTEFTPRYARDWPLIARDGLALTRGWWAMAGAIGVVLYGDVRHRCGGSVSLCEPRREASAALRRAAAPRGDHAPLSRSRNGPRGDVDRGRRRSRRHARPARGPAGDLTRRHPTGAARCSGALRRSRRHLARRRRDALAQAQGRAARRGAARAGARRGRGRRRLPERRAAPAAHRRRLGGAAGSAARRRPSRRWRSARSTPRCERIAELSGPGSQAARREAIADAVRPRDRRRAALPARRCSPASVRQGALAGVMADAVAVATGIPRANVDRATMLRGDARVVAEAALREGEAGLERFRLEVGRPVEPMLASPAASLEEAMEKVGEGVGRLEARRRAHPGPPRRRRRRRSPAARSTT